MDIEALNRELTELISRHAPRNGERATAISSLHLSRVTSTGKPLQTSLRPCFALVMQGAKSLSIGSENYEYGAGDFLIASIETPVVSRVVEASVSRPHLGLGLIIEPERIANMFVRLDLKRLDSRAIDGVGVAVNRVDILLLDAVVRLVRLLDRATDIPALAPLYKEEILYRLLMGPCRSQLLRIARADSPAKSIASATRWLSEHFAEPFSMTQLARSVGMSVSSLHHHFKAVTRVSPLQFQKQLRLNEGRRLMHVEHLDVATTSFRVGYQSVPQFTREYRRMFGLPPRRDMLKAGG